MRKTVKYFKKNPWDLVGIIMLSPIPIYLLLTLIFFTMNIGCSTNCNSNCPDAWVYREPPPPDWVKNNPANNWLAEKWEAPDLGIKENQK